MKSFLLTIAAVQILHCSGVPNPEDALRAAVMKLNEISEISHLCRTISSTVTDLSPTGKFSYNVDLAFSVKETVCSKNSGLDFDDSSCSFRPVKIAETASCRSRVKYLAGEVLDVDVECHGFKKAKDNGDSLEKLRNNREAFRGVKDQRDISQGGKVHGKPTKVGKGHRKHPERFTIHGRSSELINSSEEVISPASEAFHQAIVACSCSSSRVTMTTVHMTSEESSVEGSIKEHNDDSRARH